ncbi:MAG: hypothetical protein C4348_02690, partial [Patescibacteria group bacterium]
LSKEEIKLPEVKKEIKPGIKKEVIEVLLDELKEGENRIGNIIVKKIEPTEVKPVAIRGNIGEYEINGIKIKVNNENHEYTLYYRDQKLNGKGVLNGDPFKVYIFVYKDNTYLILSQTVYSPMGTNRVHKFYILSADAHLKPIKGLEEEIFILFESNGFIIVEHNGFLYIINSTFSSRNGHSSISIYALDKDTIKSKSYFEAFVDHPDELRVIALGERDKKLFMKINSNVIYPIPGYTVLTNEYYFIDNGLFIKNNSKFKDEYFKEALKYNEILQKENWKEHNWLSPLLSKTINLIFAGEEERAWREFFEDFAKFSQKYPIKGIEKEDPNKIKKEIQKQLSDLE